MVSQTEMHCGVVVGFIICVCLVGFTTAKCVPEKCGDLEVSYPFWINNPECGYPEFNITCMKDKHSGKIAPFLPANVSNIDDDENVTSAYYKIMDINYSGHIVIDSSSLKAFSCRQNEKAHAFKYFALPEPFYFSMDNKFVVVGCNITGTYTYGDMSGEARCVSSCTSQNDPLYCGHGCCEITIPDNYWWIKFTGEGVNPDDGLCGFSTLMDPSTFTVVDNYGLRLNWGISDENCSMARNTANYSCSSNAECIDSPSTGGHVCKCLPGYRGNGYLNGTGCIDINECSESNMCVGVKEGGICQNFPGSYNCSCAKGYTGDGFQNKTRCVSKSSNYLKLAIIGSVSSFVGVSVVACGLFWCLSIRRLKHAREKNFRQNGGIQLQERIASMGGKKGLRMFSERELEIASNNFSTELGKGGFATVYKGVLVDGTHVAIKKPKSISDEFINEIIILSHISHRNVVKLLGCCMETQFPFLVYEFVPNGTVLEHLHSTDKQLTWEARRQIAIETAEAIAYVHLQASQPIFHRDIKSSNILLDDTFTPKVADFGISRLRPSDDRHLSTMFASGTPGYVDPEFVRSSQFTDKSDVFSFGVVLVELLTGLLPLLSIQGANCTLYDHFLSAINDNRLPEILDPTVVKEENQGQMENMARLAKACLQVKAKARPSMREVVEELVWIRAATKQPGLYRDVSLVEHRGDPEQTRQNYHALPTTINSSLEDYYHSSPSVTAISSEGPSTALIQIEMSDTYAR